MHFICDDKCIYKSIWQVYIIISLTSIYILGIFYYHHMMWDWWVHTKYPFFFLEQKKKKIKALCTLKKKKFSFKSAISLYFIWNKKEETDKIITYIDIHTHNFFFIPVILSSWSHTFNYFLNWYEVVYYLYQFYFWSSTIDTR